MRPDNTPQLPPHTRTTKWMAEYFMVGASGCGRAVSLPLLPANCFTWRPLLLLLWAIKLCSMCRAHVIYLKCINSNSSRNSSPRSYGGRHIIPVAISAQVAQPNSLALTSLPRDHMVVRRSARLRGHAASEWPSTPPRVSRYRRRVKSPEQGGSVASVAVPPLASQGPRAKRRWRVEILRAMPNVTVTIEKAGELIDDKKGNSTGRDTSPSPSAGSDDSLFMELTQEISPPCGENTEADSKLLETL